MSLFCRVVIVSWLAAGIATAQPTIATTTESGKYRLYKFEQAILLDANPLDDIHNIRSVRSVVANGVLYPTAKLWDSVGFKP